MVAAVIGKKKLVLPNVMSVTFDIVSHHFINCLEICVLSLEL